MAVIIFVSKDLHFDTICAPNSTFWHSDWRRNNTKRFQRKIFAKCGRNNRKISQQMPKNVTTSWYLSQKNFILMPICAPNPAFWHSDWWRNSPKRFKRMKESAKKCLKMWHRHYFLKRSWKHIFIQIWFSIIQACTYWNLVPIEHHL